MKTVTLKIDNSIYEKFFWLLAHFSKNEIQILEPSDMTIAVEVKSIADFMDRIQKNVSDETEQPPALFYRGHADKSFQLIPSIYRLDEGKSYREVEFHLYKDMLHRNPAAFAEDKTIFERLVRMQHYELPTRLLDVTQNPLVALFFACDGFPEKDGEVLFWKKEQYDIFYSSEIPQPALAGLENYVNFENIQDIILDELSCFFNDRIKEGGFGELSKKCLDILSQRKSSDFIYIITALRQIEKIIYSDLSAFVASLADDENQNWREHESNNYREKFDNCINKIIENMCKETHVVDIGASVDNLLKSFVGFCFVYPPMNNERIRHQQGAFIVCPPIKSEMYGIEDFNKSIKITIKANAKKALLKELANMGITQSYLFPELNKQAKDITNRYPKTIENTTVKGETP